MIVDLGGRDVRSGECVVLEVLLEGAEAQYIYAVAKRQTSVTTTPMSVLTELTSLVKHLLVTQHAIMYASRQSTWRSSTRPLRASTLSFVPNVAIRKPGVYRRLTLPTGGHPPAGSRTARGRR